MDIYTRIAELRRQGESFAVATVVARQAPVSSHLGDKAIVFEDGRFEGYVGGSCSREIVRKQGLEALSTGKPRLVKITPEAAAQMVLAKAEEVVIPMTCASEGAVDVYIEPMVGKAHLLIIGASQIALTTAKVAAQMNFMVSLACDAPELAGVAPESEISVMDWREVGSWAAAHSPSRLHVLLASQGHYDEDALVLLSKLPTPAYLGLVASRKRGQTVLDNLEVLGVPRGTFPTLKYPAGLDLGAKHRDEVAVSILAEIVMLRRAGKQGEREKVQTWATLSQAASPEALSLEAVQTVQSALSELAPSPPLPPSPPPGTAVDPTSGELLDIEKAVSAEYEGQTYYFSCPNCRAKFLRNPQKYLGKGSA